MVEMQPTIEVHTAQDFADWLAANGSTATEIWPIFYKKSSGKQTVTYMQLVEVALCYGWIDVLGKKVDEERTALRFMPRRKGGNWTVTNRELARRFIAEGKMTDAGRAALPDDFLFFFAVRQHLHYLHIGNQGNHAKHQERHNLQQN